jgi:hypothetical protein
VGNGCGVYTAIGTGVCRNAGKGKAGFGGKGYFGLVDGRSGEIAAVRRAAGGLPDNGSGVLGGGNA